MGVSHFFRFTSCPPGSVFASFNRFINVDEKRVYFAWFSEGGRVAQARAFSYGNRCGGVISIGIGREKDLTVPVFLIFGDQDKQGTTSKDLPQTDTLCVRTAPGGHMWDFWDLHAEALRWLASR